MLTFFYLSLSNPLLTHHIKLSPHTYNLNPFSFLLSLWRRDSKPNRFHVLPDRLTKACSRIYMEFAHDGDVDGKVVGSSAEMELSRSGDENETGGSSVEGAFQLGLDDKINLDSPRGDIIPEAVPVVSVVPADEPYVGQEFETEAAAHAFYNAYATRVGFIIRVSKLSRSRRDGSAIGRALVCNKEGYRMPDKREKVVRQRAETRVGCRAMILVRKNEHDKIRELSQQLAIEKKRAATYKRHLNLIFEHIEEHNESLSKKIQHIVESVKEIEGKEQQGYR